VFPCQYWVGNERWYNLKPLQKGDGDFYTVKTSTAGEEILFNFCQPFSPVPKYANCPSIDRFGYIVKSSTQG